MQIAHHHRVHTDEADHELARRLATGAGEILLDVRSRLASSGATAAALKQQGDTVANRWLMEQLAAHRPDDPVLSEEEHERPDALAERLRSRRAWIVDPLDGTREFSEPPRPDWAVHVALAVDGRPVVGAVALPALGVTLATSAERPTPLAPPVDGPPRVIVSRSRPPAVALRVAAALDGVLVEMGSAGAKAMAIVRGQADIYVHAGGQYEWDSCAPVAVATAAGLHCSRLDGSELTYNNEDPWLPDLIVCRAEMAAAVLDAANSPS